MNQGEERPQRDAKDRVYAERLAISEPNKTLKRKADCGRTTSTVKKKQNHTAHPLVKLLEKWILHNDEKAFQEFKKAIEKDNEKIDGTEHSLEKNIKKLKKRTVGELHLAAYCGNKYAAAVRVTRYYNDKSSHKKTWKSYRGATSNSNQYGRIIQQIEQKIQEWNAEKDKKNEQDLSSAASSHVPQDDIDVSVPDTHIASVGGPKSPEDTTGVASGDNMNVVANDTGTHTKNEQQSSNGEVAMSSCCKTFNVAEEYTQQGTEDSSNHTSQLLRETLESRDMGEENPSTNVTSVDNQTSPKNTIYVASEGDTNVTGAQQSSEENKVQGDNHEWKLPDGLIGYDGLYPEMLDFLNDKEDGNKWFRQHSEEDKDSGNKTPGPLDDCTTDQHGPQVCH